MVRRNNRKDPTGPPRFAPPTAPGWNEPGASASRRSKSRTPRTRRRRKVTERPRSRIVLLEVLADDPVPAKIGQKHGLNATEVTRALRYPADVRTEVEYDEREWHIVAHAELHDGLPIVARLYPDPASDREGAERWFVATAMVAAVGRR